MAAVSAWVTRSGQPVPSSRPRRCTNWNAFRAAMHWSPCALAVVRVLQRFLNVSESEWSGAGHRPWEDDEPTISEASGIRYLHFGSEWVQGAMRLRRPNDLIIAYTQQMMAWLLLLEPDAETE